MIRRSSPKCRLSRLRRSGGPTHLVEKPVTAPAAQNIVPNRRECACACHDFRDGEKRVQHSVVAGAVKRTHHSQADSMRQSLRVTSLRQPNTTRFPVVGQFGTLTRFPPMDLPLPVREI